MLGQFQSKTCVCRNFKPLNLDHREQVILLLLLLLLLLVLGHDLLSIWKQVAAPALTPTYVLQITPPFKILDIFDLNC